MGEGVFLTPSGKLAKAYAERAAGLRKEDARILEINIEGLERDNRHLVMRYQKAKHTSVLDEPAHIYTVDTPIPIAYIKQVWTPGGAIPSPLPVARANPKPHPLPRQWPLGLRYLSADSSVEDQYPGIHDHPLGPITLWHGSPHSRKLNSFLHNGIIPGVESGIASKGGGGSDKGKVSLTPYRWEAHGYAAQSARDEKGTGHTMIVIPEGHIGLMIGVRGSLLEHPD